MAFEYYFTILINNLFKTLFIYLHGFSYSAKY